MTIKHLWKVTFCWAREIEIVRTQATSGRQAKGFAINQIARRHGVHPSYVYGMFDGSKPNCTVEREIEYKEIDDEKKDNRMVGDNG